MEETGNGRGICHAFLSRSFP